MLSLFLLVGLSLTADIGKFQDNFVQRELLNILISKTARLRVEK